MWLSQEDDNGWRPNGTLTAASAAWQSLSRLRHGDWPLPGDPRLNALPLHPCEIEWIEWERDGYGHEETRGMEFTRDGHAPFVAARMKGETGNERAPRFAAFER